MLKHYSHIRMEAKRKALEAIVPKTAAKGTPSSSPQTSGQIEIERATEIQTDFAATA